MAHSGQKRMLDIIRSDKITAGDQRPCLAQPDKLGAETDGQRYWRGCLHPVCQTQAIAHNGVINRQATLFPEGQQASRINHRRCSASIMPRIPARMAACVS